MSYKSFCSYLKYKINLYKFVIDKDCGYIDDVNEREIGYLVNY